ncbi:MAG TPA: hypothetical protein VFJ52_01800, partial [Terriglobia bacterium]|nr:hypothetical protein [Terriglobia bacterium]
SRAVNVGGLIQAKESGVVEGKRWLAAPSCCEKCQKLDGKTVPLEADFHFEPEGGAYAHIQTAPYHPHCRCSTGWVLKEEWR